MNDLANKACLKALHSIAREVAKPELDTEDILTKIDKTLLDLTAQLYPMDMCDQPVEDLLVTLLDYYEIGG